LEADLPEGKYQPAQQPRNRHVADSCSLARTYDQPTNRSSEYTHAKEPYAVGKVQPRDAAGQVQLRDEANNYSLRSDLVYILEKMR
jgi:hypothetical protein